MIDDLLLDGDERALEPLAKSDIEALVASSGLTPQQVKGAVALASGCSVTQAAKEAKVNRATCSTWLNHDEKFRSFYLKLVRAGMEETRAELLGLSRLAVSTISKLLDNPYQQPGAALAAARLVLTAAHIIGEQDQPPSP